MHHAGDQLDGALDLVLDQDGGGAGGGGDRAVGLGHRGRVGQAEPHAADVALVYQPRIGRLEDGGEAERLRCLDRLGSVLRHRPTKYRDAEAVQQRGRNPGWLPAAAIP